jgi:hypothetical protein
MAIRIRILKTRSKISRFCGKTKNYRGYIMIYHPHHPYPSAGNGKYVFEHRLVMEKNLGRYLMPKERVHHIDSNKTNNSFENLKLFKNPSDHIKFHHFIRKFQMVD